MSRRPQGNPRSVCPVCDRTYIRPKKGGHTGLLVSFVQHYPSGRWCRINRYRQVCGTACLRAARARNEAQKALIALEQAS